MNLGFGNNIRATLAADINSTQTAIAVMPGTGALFVKTLQADTSVANPSFGSTLYAKVTLTDALETVFEICHLLSVSGDNLTVIRGQEGTAAKGWSLNDVISNFSTRGSENTFVQIEDLQNGKYLSATAGGTENALTIALPSTFYINGGNTFALRAPLHIKPTLTNTGATTVQLTVSGKIVGTYPLVKGNNLALEAGDIAADSPIVILFSQELSRFLMINPAKGLVDSALFLEKSKNLSDLTDAAAARKNLGIPDCPFEVGDVIFKGNNNDPNTKYPGTTWLDLSKSYDSRNIMIGTVPLSYGGSDSVTLTQGQLPSHGHTFSGSTDSAGSHTHFGVPARSWNYELGGDNNVKFNPYDEGYTDAAGEHTHTVQGTIGATGGGEAFSIVSRFLQLRAWMRTA